MPINGRIIVAGVSMAFPCPQGMLSMIGVDGGHYIAARDGTSPNFLEICYAEGLDDDNITITNDQFRTDIFNQLGLVDGGSGSSIIGADCHIEVPGTPYFFILGDSYVDGTIPFQYQIYGLRYKITGPGTYVIDGKIHLYLSFAINGLIGGTVVGSMIVGNEVFFVVDTFDTSLGDFRERLIKLPLTGDLQVLATGSWDNQRYNFPSGDMSATVWWPSGGSLGDPKNTATIINHPDGVMILAYRRGSPSSLRATVIRIGEPAPGTNTGDNTISSTFGIPFPDEGFNFVGAPSVFGDDFYCNPSVNILSNGNLEWFFMRGYSDNDGWIGVRRFITDSELNILETFDLSQIQITTDVGITLESVHALRENNEVIYMIREDSALTFKTVVLVIPPEFLGAPKASVRWI